MSECEGILQAIGEEPGDETNWHVLADWLEENAQDDRAELTRLQQSLRNRRQCQARRKAEERVRDLLLAGVKPCVPIRTNSIGMELTIIPAGVFRMGSPVNETRRMLDEPLHRVEITRAFWMGMYQVTQGQFEKLMGTNPSTFGPGNDVMTGIDTAQCPVDSVTWDEAIRFCQVLNRREQRIRLGWEYRLPTEAEWEYACRAWNSTRWPFYFGPVLNPTLANFDGRYPYPPDFSEEGDLLGHPTMVGQYPPNAFGLYDMHGNLEDWCSDWFDGGYYLVSPRSDPTGPSRGRSKVYRGGAWSGQAEDCRAAVRIGRPAELADSRIGFRVVLAQK